MPVPHDGDDDKRCLCCCRCCCRDELTEYDPFDDGSFCRSRFWLFVSYIVSFASIVGAVWVLLQHYGERCRGGAVRVLLLHGSGAALGFCSPQRAGPCAGLGVLAQPPCW